MKKVFAGAISISRFSSNMEPRDGVNITIRDGTSGVEFVDVLLTMEQFGRAVSGLSLQDCTFELRGVDKVGLQHEHKTEKVVVPEGFSSRQWKSGEVDALLAPYEVDGWIAYRPDLGNHHNYDRKKSSYAVAFHRYVKKD